MDANLVIQATTVVVASPNFVWQNGFTNTSRNKDSYGTIGDSRVRSISKPRVVEVPMVSSKFEKNQDVKTWYNLRIEL
jgi:hypothetical protein